MISWRNVQQNTTRTDRTARKAGICRTFVRSALHFFMARIRSVIASHLKYRPRIERVEMSRFAGLPPR
jgi:hypothetical protein